MMCHYLRNKKKLLLANWSIRGIKLLEINRRIISFGVVRVTPLHHTTSRFIIFHHAGVVDSLLN